MSRCPGRVTPGSTRRELPRRSSPSRQFRRRRRLTGILLPAPTRFARPSAPLRSTRLCRRGAS
eukprot:2976222-Alexandrium_andersonii.AAC.1